MFDLQYRMGLLIKEKKEWMGMYDRVIAIDFQNIFYLKIY
jgi:hypothetical protein